MNGARNGTCFDKRAKEDHPPSRKAALAQLVEQGTENPCVLGSIPRRGTTSKTPVRVFFCLEIEPYSPQENGSPLSQNNSQDCFARCILLSALIITDGAII